VLCYGFGRFFFLYEVMVARAFPFFLPLDQLHCAFGHRTLDTFCLAYHRFSLSPFLVGSPML
jgi:hypothetical protein